MHEETRIPASFGPLDDAGLNQTPAFGDFDLLAHDRPLQDALALYGAGTQELHRFATTWGRAATFELGRLANEFVPRLRTVDPAGRRIDRVDFHPAYHELMTLSMKDGLHCSVWDAAPGQPATVIRAARIYIASGVEAGHVCPITMTNAAVASLRAEPDLLRDLAPKLSSRRYDPRPLPWWEKDSMTIGMGMTERQGGTDVRANLTRAHNASDRVEITGHKWFMSAPMCDAFLVLAQAEGGLSCFFVPRYRPDGSPNALKFLRLKDKLGNRSNASSEVEFLGAFARQVGPAGAGVKTIIEMVSWTRLDCAVSSAGLMRMGLAHAIHHARHRSVFQRPLFDQPAMRAVLAEMALELEGIVAAAFRLAHAFDRMTANPQEAAYARLMTPAIKYLACKRAPGFLYEALECHGGNGYVEELPLARYYREAPLNAIWEGSGNVMALDMLRAAVRAPEATRDVIARLVQTAQAAFDCAPLERQLQTLLTPTPDDRHARRLIEGLGKLAAVAALVEARSPFASPYAAARIWGGSHDHYGAADIAPGTGTALLERAWAV